MHSNDENARPFRDYSSAQLWSSRMPSPPRIVVPPPGLNTQGLPDLQVVQNASPNFEASGFTNTEFLQTVTYNNFLKQNAMLEWKYEDRRKAQQVLPFLYLGPSSAARDENFLKEEGITMALAVRNTSSAQAKLLWSKAGEALDLEVKAIDVAGEMELIAAFPRGIEAINAHLSQVYLLSEQGRAPIIGGSVRNLGKVLVFCESGNERSASLVAAYIMAMYSKDLITTLQIVNAQRFSVAFDDDLRNLLLTYQDIVKAKRDVVLHNTESDTALRSMNGKVKRSYDEADVVVDNEVEMTADAIVNLTNGNGMEKREGLAPFQG